VESSLTIRKIAEVLAKIENRSLLINCPCKTHSNYGPCGEPGTRLIEVYPEGGQILIPCEKHFQLYLAYPHTWKELKLNEDI
jgi:hypothetical protein